MLTVFDAVVIFLICLLAPPLLAYLIAQGWTYGRLLATRRFYDRIQEEEQEKNDGK